MAWRRSSTALKSTLQQDIAMLIHKAFSFNWKAFETELKVIIEVALRSNKTNELEAFIERQRKILQDPYEGTPLPKNWHSKMESRDVQEFADFALTGFYDPLNDCGVAENYVIMSDQLPKQAANALLGFPLGEQEKLFDPGQMGSYFQDLSQVEKSLKILSPLTDDLHEIKMFVELLENCLAKDLGLYVTF